MSQSLVTVEGVSKKFCRSLKKSLWYGLQDIGHEFLGKQHDQKNMLRTDEFWALKDVGFELKRGECLGLIGRNGAGKTTLLRMLNGLIKPDQGRIKMHGRVGGLIALGAGFNGILTGRENIYVNASVLGLTRQEINEKLDEIIDFAEIGEFIDMPVQSYSSGMTVRLGFAVASTIKPDVLLLDEVLAVGDANFRSKCWRRIGEHLEHSAVILVSHEAYAISRVCDRAILLEKGEVICDANANEALSIYSATQAQSVAASLQATHHTVTRYEIFAINNHIQPGEYFEFELIVDMKQDQPVDYGVVNIIDSGEVVHSQSFLNFPHPGFRIGINVFRIRLGPLYLSRGQFALMVMINTAGGKVLLIHSRHEVRFMFDSHVNYGPSYYPPANVTRSN